MNILINGASGYIGYHLTKEMLDAGHTVYAVCRNSPGHLAEIGGNNRLNIIIARQDALAEKLSGTDICAWYQLLWDGAVREKRSDPVLQISNELHCVNSLKTAEQIGCRKIIFAGTVYENFADDILQSELPNNHSFYIIAKKHAHDVTLQLSKEMRIQYVWVQFCHPVGRFMDKTQLFPYAVDSFVNNKPTAFGSCENRFDIISVDYLVRAMRAIGEMDAADKFYYIGSGQPRKLRDYLVEAASICGYSLPIGFGKRADDGLVFRKEWFDCSGFSDEFKLSENHSLREMINSII